MQKYFQNTAPAVVISIAILLATVIGASAFYKIRSLDNTLSVTGSTKMRVKADLAKWTITTNSIVAPTQVSYAYSIVSNDMAKIKNFLIKNGILANQMTLSPIYNDDYWSGNSERKVNVRQTVTINSNELEKIKTISENMSALSQDGVVFAPESPQYYVSSLPDLRVSLIGKAVLDAQARAKEIASSMNQSVGKLKSASSGVVQVLQPDSNDVSDYGQYDTLTIDKDVMVTVRATFLLK
jgi:uncharacterized protein